MPLLLRKIRFERWLRPSDGSWLPEREVWADPLGDLATKNNGLSVWEVEDNKSNLAQVAVALALTSDKIDGLAYALVDKGRVSQLGINIKTSEGNSPDRQANSLHRDLTTLSARKLVELAKTILFEGEQNQFLEKEIFQLIDAAMASGRVDQTKLKPKHKEQLEQFKAAQHGHP